MPKRWLAVVVVLVACSSKRDEQPPETEIEIELPRPPPPPAPAPAAPRPLVQDPLQDLLNQRRPRVQTPPPAPPMTCLTSAEIVLFEARPALRACVDDGQDGVADRCARWRPDGSLIGVEPYVEHDAVEPPEDPVTFHSDTEHNDDSRIDLTGGTVEICPYDRTCLKLMPRLDDGELPQVATDLDYRKAALVVRSSDGTQGAVELWDLDRGRRYAKLPYRGLRRDEEYTFSVKLGPGALLALAERDRDSSVAGAIYGLDGGYRGALGGGSPTLDAEGALETAGLYAIVDPQTDERPYVVHVVDLVAGGAARRFVIPREPGADSLELQRLAPGVFAAKQQGKQLRLDVIDTRRGGARVLRAPAC